ncbi:MAG: ISL3 family transposase, partial [Mangrovibacterium sp.]
MNSEQIFGIALGLQAPWRITGVEFKETGKGGKELHLTIGFSKGTKFGDSSGVLSPVHDTLSKS